MDPLTTTAHSLPTWLTIELALIPVVLVVLGVGVKLYTAIRLVQQEVVYIRESVGEVKDKIESHVDDSVGVYTRLTRLETHANLPPLPRD